MQILNGVFVVTGGGSGLGAATARMLVEAGAKVVLADVNRDAGEALAAELGSAAAFALTDVTDADSGKAAIDLAVSRFGRLTGLVSCAGVAPAEKVVGRDAPPKLDSFARPVSITLIGTFNMLRLAADVMGMAQPAAGGARGILVTTGSGAGVPGRGGRAGSAPPPAAASGSDSDDPGRRWC